MRNILIKILCFTFVAAGLASCCKVCSKSGVPDVQLCRDNFASDQEYENAVSWYETASYTCK